MKSKFINYVLILVVIVSFFSCDDSPLMNNHKSLSFKLLGVDDINVAAVFYTTHVKDYSETYDRSDSNTLIVFAYITDGYDFINPTAVLVNNTQLTNMDDYNGGYSTGQFIGGVEPFPSGPPYIINWQINGWSGNNYVGTQTISNKLDFPDSHYLDTVSASSNFNISYTGYENYDSISVFIFPASGENFIFLGLTSSPPNSSYNFESADNGTLIIPSSILSLLPKNFYYTIEITNFKQSKENFGSFSILKKSIYDLATVIYLNQ